MPSSIGTLRHCLMAGMCSAAVSTGTRRGTGANYQSERNRLNNAKWRCPYSSGNTATQYTKPYDDDSRRYSRITLHCERKWIEENS